MVRELPTRARIIIADDHPLFRFALVTLLRGCPDFEMVGEAADGQEALKLCSRLKPDLVLMDVIMPGMSGIEAVRVIKRELPRTIVLIMTASVEPSHLAEAIKAGAAGYILKSACPEEIIGAVRAVLVGDSPLNQEVAMRLILDLMDEQSKEERPPSDVVAPEDSPALGEEHLQGEETLPSSLTGREVEILGLLMRGHTNHKIAHELLLSTSTVKKHVSIIISKLGVSDRTQAAVRAIELGLRPERIV